MPKSLTFAILMAAVCLPYHSSRAQPPDGADPIYAPYYRSLRLLTPGKKWMGYCCTSADCRDVESRMVDGHWEVLIDKKSFGPKAPDDWMVVPNDVHADSDLDAPRPTRGVACFYDGKVRCFDKPLTQG